MYPYEHQLLRRRSADADRKLGGLVMEVKGDFCQQVRAILTHAEREKDYVESEPTPASVYHPLHNDLDPYAVARDRHAAEQSGR